jgi:hypothetical protein
MDEMKTIQDFIEQHAGMFDSEEPDQGHLERLRIRMDLMQAAEKRKNRNLWLRIAAILVVCVIISYTAFREFSLIDQQLQRNTSGAINHELNEAELFYTSQLSIYYNKIQKLGFNNDKAEKKKVLQELTAMDYQVQLMKYDLKQNPDDERIVHAIIHFYQVKIELMDVIIARAQQPTNTIL